MYYLKAPFIKKNQNDVNNCCFVSLEYSLSAPGEEVSEQTIATCIEDLLNCYDQVLNIEYIM